MNVALQYSITMNATKDYLRPTYVIISEETHNEDTGSGWMNPEYGNPKELSSGWVVTGVPDFMHRWAADEADNWCVS